ncbi:hypothetical protein [Kordia sp.]|uniref:hypothetical protein n=1 Tax=Kordia sp. TaxID=1965332 RepID=UPI003D6ADCFB
MKKRNLRILKLEKKSISIFKTHNIKGGNLCTCKSFCGSCDNTGGVNSGTDGDL